MTFKLVLIYDNLFILFNILVIINDLKMQDIAGCSTICKDVVL